MHSPQRDLFHLLSLPKPDYTPKPEHVRARLHDMLARLRAGEPMPHTTIRLWRMIFPQMTNWLPAEEAGQLKAEFTTALQQLEKQHDHGL